MVSLQAHFLLSFFSCTRSPKKKCSLQCHNAINWYLSQNGFEGPTIFLLGVPKRHKVKACQNIYTKNQNEGRTMQIWGTFFQCENYSPLHPLTMVVCCSSWRNEDDVDDEKKDKMVEYRLYERLLILSLLPVLELASTATSSHMRWNVGHTFVNFNRHVVTGYKVMWYIKVQFSTL